MAEDKKEIDVSIVIPFYNEEENIPILYEKITKVMSGLNKEYELIFVNDGSKDNTGGALKNLFRADARVTIITLRRNFGQTAALAAGFDLAKGEIIISMDGDLQDEPGEIPRFLEEIARGFDIVNGWRKERSEDNFFTRRLPSRIANKIMSVLSGVKINDFGSTFKAYRREVIKDIELSSDLHRFIPALASSMGVKIIEIPIKRLHRIKGHSNYGLSRILPVLYDFIIVKFFISYLSNPMKIFGLLGILSFGVGFCFALILTLGYYFFGLSMRQQQGNIILSVFLMLGGLQFILSGILAELCVRIYRRGSNQKIYCIKKIEAKKTEDSAC